MPQPNDVAYPMHQEEKETTKTNQKKPHHANVQFVFTVMAKVHALSSKLWQKLPQSINELLWHNIRVLTRILKIGVKMSFARKNGVLSYFFIGTFEKVVVKIKKLE